MGTLGGFIEGLGVRDEAMLAWSSFVLLRVYV